MISIYMVLSDFNRITTADWLMPFDLFISQTTANVINFAYWVIFPAFVVIADLKLFSKHSFWNTITVSNGLDSDQHQHSYSPNLGPNCLQRVNNCN